MLPPFGEINPLRMRDTERRIESLEPNGTMKSLSLIFLPVSEAIRISFRTPCLSTATGSGGQQEFSRLVPNGVLKDSFPIVAALQPHHVGKDLKAKRAQLRAKPEREGVALWRRVTDEKRCSWRGWHRCESLRGDSR